jgi:hypothetical protein
MAVLTPREQARAERLETLVKDINIIERRPDRGLHSLQLDYRGDNERGVNMWELEEVVTYSGAVKPARGIWGRLNGVQMLRYLQKRYKESHDLFWDKLNGRAEGSIYHCHLCKEWWDKKSFAPKKSVA